MPIAPIQGWPATLPAPSVERRLDTRQPPAKPAAHRPILSGAMGRTAAGGSYIAPHPLLRRQGVDVVGFIQQVRLAGSPQDQWFGCPRESAWPASSANSCHSPTTRQRTEQGLRRGPPAFSNAPPSPLTTSTMQRENEAYTEAYLESVVPVHQLPRRWYERAAWRWLLAGECANSCRCAGLAAPDIKCTACLAGQALAGVGFTALLTRAPAPKAVSPKRRPSPPCPAVRTVVGLLTGTFGRSQRVSERQLARRAMMLNCDGQATALSGKSALAVQPGLLVLVQVCCNVYVASLRWALPYVAHRLLPCCTSPTHETHLPHPDPPHPAPPCPTPPILPAVVIGHCRSMVRNTSDSGWVHTLAAEVECMRAQYASECEELASALLDQRVVGQAACPAHLQVWGCSRVPAAGMDIACMCAGSTSA